MQTVSILRKFAREAGLLVVPLAAALYLVTTVTWTAVENALLRRGLPARGD